MGRHVCAFDLSLTSTGYADSSGTQRIVPKKMTGVERLQYIADAVDARIKGFDVVVIEGYAYGRPNQAHQIGELGGVVRLTIHDRNIPLVVVPPSSLKKFATGKGNAKKDEMIAAAIRKYGFMGSGNDEADAWLLYCMADAALNGDRSDLTNYQKEAIDAIQWPEVPL